MKLLKVNVYSNGQVLLKYWNVIERLCAFQFDFVICRYFF